MKLFFRKTGQGQPFIILHGLFGQSDNWNTLARQFAEQGFEVFTVDLRNHGLSPHSDTLDYKTMSDDVLKLITDNQLSKVVLAGHSMGGKVAMHFALQDQQLLDKLIIIDIAPKYYPMHHQLVLEALQAVDFSKIKTRKEIEEILSTYITDFGTKQFLLKNIYWKTDTELAWRFNLKVVIQQISNLGEATPTDTICSTPTLFIRGAKSNYILNEDLELIHKIFPESALKTIADAAHWVHAEKPKAFFECVMEFVK